MAIFDEKLMTMNEYAAQRPITVERVGQRVSALVNQRFTLRGRIESFFTSCGERRAFVRWDSGESGSWTLDALRAG